MRARQAVQSTCSIERAAAVTRRVETVRAVISQTAWRKRVTAGRLGIFADSSVEPVSGFEPLTVRLQEGLSFAGSERDFTAISPLTCIKACRG
jgi:hypothetical protein